MDFFNPALILQQLDDALVAARRAGAQEADALFSGGWSSSAAWHDGKLESLEAAEGGEIGLRVLIGHKQAMAATSDLRPKALKELAEHVTTMAKAAGEDPFCGLAEPEVIAKTLPVLESEDAYAVTPADLMAWAKEGEEAALSVSGVTRCEGAEAGCSRSLFALAGSNGFSGHALRTRYSISVSALAGEGTAMERGFDFSSAVFQSDLAAASTLGRTAGARAVKNLGARKMPTCAVPVVFSPEAAHELLGAFVDSIRGGAVARATSFLKDSMGQQVFAKGVNVWDDPHRPRGLSSRAFDAEGLPTRRRVIVEDGRLASWLLDLCSARQLGLESTGHAARGISGPPHASPTNFYMEGGALSPDALMKDIESGFYVIEMMGTGINDVTGDFSQAARGFWIENGALAFPVSEMTIAGNLKDMFLNLRPANDLVFRYGINAPTVRVEGLTVAGV